MVECIVADGSIAKKWHGKFGKPVGKPVGSAEPRWVANALSAKPEPDCAVADYQFIFAG
jgi:hypothetical protein